jgi:hypothetical protein
MSIALLEPPSSAGRRLADRRRETLGPQRSLVVDHGCDVRIGHWRLEPTAVLALLAWLPVGPGDLAPIEARAEELDALAALALVLRPPTIWTASEALGVRGHAFRARRIVTRLHCRRLRRTAARIASQLPVPGLERASELVEEGCAIVVRDAEACADVAAAQLDRYATSDLIARL